LRILYVMIFKNLVNECYLKMHFFLSMIEKKKNAAVVNYHQL